ncbi:hypothetical protein [uncultured Akkermansia sp.]|uniref:hypothetical protein n=1 Tax=uncultured Akkermansia sp. TaxID=512294 RepID=UPI002631F63B|nr:hypothetical protein [uncultured Akkermansia sp.]
MMETDTLMAEASFFIRIENSHQEKTATPFIEKRETGGAKLFPERNAKSVFPENDGNSGRQHGRNTAENSNRQEYSGIMRKGAFLILLFSMNLLVFSHRCTTYSFLRREKSARNGKKKKITIRIRRYS